MPREWTDAQSAAISIRNKNLLISAAAGSGKTATLTERIIRSLTDKENPADISEILVVTFTRAAAAELKQRIFSAVSDAVAKDPTNKHLSSQLVKISSAKICTIDSFYLDLIRENFSSLGLPPSFRIADTAESELLAKEIMEDTVNRFYDETEDFPRIAESFSNVRSASRLTEVFLNLYSHVSSYPEGIDFLKFCGEKCISEADKDFFESSFGTIIRWNAEDAVTHFIEVLNDLIPQLSICQDIYDCYYRAFSYDLDFCLELLERIFSSTYEETRDLFLSYEPLKLKTPHRLSISETSKMLKDKRSDITKALRELCSKSFALSPKNISTAMKETGRITLKIYELISEFEQKLTAEKLRRGICDFNDIRRYALKLLVYPNGTPTETAKNLSRKFTDIYIDEYQDVDRVQDMIFSAISNGRNRFMVGDIKQSIYSFRGAEPDVFAEYRESFPQHESEARGSFDSQAIFMSNNFRCDENIVKFTNTVCSYLFGKCTDSSVYSEDDELIFSKALPSPDYVSPKVSVSVVVPPEDEDSDYVSNAANNKLCEARYVASKISELLANGKKADGSRILPEDVAVLLRSSTMKPYLKQAFKEAGIEASGDAESKYFESPDVLLVLSVLNSVDNPHRDVYLAGTLHSPLFDFSLDELVILRKSCEPAFSLYDAVELYSQNEDGALGKKCKDFLEVLTDWRAESLSMPVDKLIKTIYSSKQFSVLGLASSENLIQLYEYARRFESGAFKGLYNFIEYVNKLIAEGKQFDTASSDSASGKVSIMTIHHSKGLEFPVCFLCGTSGEFNRSEFKESMLFEYTAGVAMKIADETGFARINTPMRDAIASKITANRTEEEMRVLYVALTRAREYLFVTGNSSKSKDRLLEEAAERDKFSDKYSLLKCKSYLEWILTALAGADIGGICDISFVHADTVSIPIARKLSSPEENIRKEEETHAERVKPSAELLEKLSFKYPFTQASRIPAKISVSRLSDDLLDDETDMLTYDVDKKTAVPSVFLNDSSHKFTPSERGTLTHLFFQFCDFAYAEKHGAEEELARLIEKRFLPSYAAEAVFTDDLKRFFASELFSKIKGAKKIVREQRFNILLPASMFSKDNEFIENVCDEPLAVQGVIDIIVIDERGELCLYDYKTDRLSPAERNDSSLLKKKMYARHSEQLSYYKIAVERLFGQKCSSVGIYSTHAAKTVEWE
ncbi:MAG: helicase-exonuclease AddAB subunit AddA [Clostridia bacterium]|nr:helicase-exonuclease AddAB subunit AddA [Clostridia bacterium]